MKKVYIILTVLMLGVAGMAYLYFSNLNKESSGSDYTIELVSSHAAVVFNFENDLGFFEILSGQKVTDEIVGADKAKFLGSLRNELIKNQSVNQFINGEKVYIGFVPIKNNDIGLVIATQIADKGAKNNINELLKLTNAKQEGKFYHLVFGDSVNCYASIKHSSVAISNDIEVLEKLEQDKKDKNEFANYIKQNSRFTKNTLANVYIDYNGVPSILKNILNSTLTGELSVFNQKNAYAALSYNFSTEKLLLNGYTDIKDDRDYLKLFVSQPEQKISIDLFFPAQTANYVLYQINDYERWRKDLLQWQKEKKEDVKIEQQQKLINEKYRIDLQQAFPKYFNQQLALFQLNTGEKLGIAALKNGDKLGQLLLDLSSEYAPDIRIFKESDLLYHFFGEPFKKFERPFYTIIDNHLVVANHASSIQVFLNSYRNNKLLSAMPDYKYYKEQTSNSATVAFYINHQNSNAIFGKNLKMPYYKQYNSSAGFKDYDSFGYQLSADNGKFMSNILLLKKAQKITPEVAIP